MARFPARSTFLSPPSYLLRFKTFCGPTHVWAAFTSASLTSLMPTSSLLLALLLSVSLCDGQITDVTNSTSVPIPGVGHNYLGALSETVDPANGSVSLRIPIPIPPARGVTLPLSIAYDTQGVYIPDVSTNQAGFSTDSGAGWGPIFPRLTTQKNTYTILVHGTRFDCYDYTNFMLIDSQGGRHALGLKTQFHGNYSGCDPRETLSGGDIAYRAATQHNGNVTQTTVADSDGTVYSWTGTVTALATSVEDRNGNKLQITSAPNSPASVVDAVGRTAVTLSGSESTGKTLAVSGLGAPYQLEYGPASSNFGVDWPLLTSPSTGCQSTPNMSANMTALTSLAMPNGQSYSFSYDPVYGLISSLTYPSGGKITYVWTTNPLAAAGNFWNSYYQKSGCVWQFSKPALLHRYVSVDGQTNVLEQDFAYSTVWGTGNSTGYWINKTTTVTTRDLVRGTSFTTTYLYGPVLSGEPNQFAQYVAADGQIPAEQTITYNDTSGTTIETVNKVWYNAQQLMSEQNTFGTQTSKTTYAYGSGGQLIERDDYDFGASTAMRQTVAHYQTFNTTPIFPALASILDQIGRAHV